MGPESAILNQINQKYSAEKLLFFADYNNWYNMINKTTGSMVSGTYTWNFPLNMFYKQFSVVGIGGGAGGGGGTTGVAIQNQTNGGDGNPTFITINGVIQFKFLGGGGGQKGLGANNTSSKNGGNGGSCSGSNNAAYGNYIVPILAGGLGGINYSGGSNGGYTSIFEKDFVHILMSGAGGAGSNNTTGAYPGGNAYFTPIGGTKTSAYAAPGGAGAGIGGGNGGNTATSGSNATGYGSGGGGGGSSNTSNYNASGAGGGGAGVLSRVSFPLLHNAMNQTSLLITIGTGGISGSANTLGGGIGGYGTPGAIWIYGII